MNNILNNMIAANVDVTAQASLCCQYCAIKGSACMVKVSFKRNKLHMHKIPSSRPEYYTYL